MLRLLPLDFDMLRVGIQRGGAAATRDPFKLSKMILRRRSSQPFLLFNTFQTSRTRQLVARYSSGGKPSEDVLQHLQFEPRQSRGLSGLDPLI